MADVKRGRGRGNSGVWDVGGAVAPEFPLPIPVLTPATQAIKTAGQRQL